MAMKEAPTGVTVAEKFFGLIIILIGTLVTYFTYVSLEALSKMFGQFTGIFLVSGLALIAIGILLLLAKAE